MAILSTKMRNYVRIDAGLGIGYILLVLVRITDSLISLGISLCALTPWLLGGYVLELELGEDLAEGSAVLWDG